MTTGDNKPPADNGLSEDHKRALASLAHIALGSMSHTIERYAANDLLNYIGELERQRTEARSALTASGEALRTVRDGLICTRQAPHQYDANHYCANCGSDHARLKDVIDAAMEKANG